MRVFFYDFFRNLRGFTPPVSPTPLPPSFSRITLSSHVILKCSGHTRFSTPAATPTLGPTVLPASPPRGVPADTETGPPRRERMEGGLSLEAGTPSETGGHGRREGLLPHPRAPSLPDPQRPPPHASARSRSGVLSRLSSRGSVIPWAETGVFARGSGSDFSGGVKGCLFRGIKG